MTLIKTSLLNAIAVAIKLLTMLGINKILAVYVGPTGYAAFGQFQNAIQMITTFGSGAISIGVTKYTAEYHHSEDLQRQVWRTAGGLALIGSIVTGGLVTLFNHSLASWFLKDAGYHSIFIWFGLTLIFFIFNTLLLAILNGKKEISAYVLINIVGSLFSITVSALMIMRWGLYGALLTLTINQSMLFFVTLVFCYRTSWFKLNYLFGAINRDIAIKLGKYALMALISALSIPMSQILIRNHLGESFGWKAAGYWEAMNRLSAAYLMFVTTTLSVYYLPRLSELCDPVAIKKEIIRGYRLILPIAIGCAFFIYMQRDLIIGLIFTESFSPMRELFAWQMLGDILKIASWLLGYVLTAKAMMKGYIISEVFFSLTFVGLVYVLTGELGIKGAPIAYAINYCGHLSFMYYYLKSKGVIS